MVYRCFKTIDTLDVYGRPNHFTMVFVGDISINGLTITMVYGRYNKLDNYS